MIDRSRFHRAGVAVLAALAGAASLAYSPAEVGAQPASTSKPAIVHDGVWHLRDSLTTGAATTSFRYGRGTDLAVMGDWDGDGDETVGVARIVSTTGGFYAYEWHLRNSNTAGAADVTPFVYGRVWGDDGSSANPLVGDWDGDGDDTVGTVTYAPTAEGAMSWQVRDSNTPGLPEVVAHYSRGYDLPVVGDWDGDGDETFGVVRGDRWLLSNQLTGGRADLDFVYGSSSYEELPVTGDWDGNGTDTPAILRNVPPTEAYGGYERWLYRNANSGGSADGQFTFGSDAQSTFPGSYSRMSWR